MQETIHNKDYCFVMLLGTFGVPTLHGLCKQQLQDALKDKKEQLSPAARQYCIVVMFEQAA